MECAKYSIVNQSHMPKVQVLTACGGKQLLYQDEYAIIRDNVQLQPPKIIRYSRLSAILLARVHA